MGLRIVAPCCAALLILAVSCSTGPAPAAKGTPPFYWQAAREAFAAGDYIKTSEHLENLTKTNNEFTARARPWRLILLAGLGQGYMELADHFDYGAKANKSNPTPFRRRISDYRSMAARNALDFADALQRFGAAQKDGDVVLDFGAPGGSANQVAQLTQIGNGVLPTASDLETTQKTVLERNVLLATCRAVGAPNDQAKVVEVLKTPPATIPGATFRRAMAENLYDLGGLFSRQKLDLPDRQTLFYTRAQEGLAGLADDKELKEIRAKIEKGLKELKARKT